MPKGLILGLLLVLGFSCFYTLQLKTNDSGQSLNAQYSAHGGAANAEDVLQIKGMDSEATSALLSEKGASANGVVVAKDIVAVRSDDRYYLEAGSIEVNIGEFLDVDQDPDSYIPIAEKTFTVGEYIDVDRLPDEQSRLSLPAEEIGEYIDL